MYGVSEYTATKSKSDVGDNVVRACVCVCVCGGRGLIVLGGGKKSISVFLLRWTGWERAMDTEQGLVRIVS